MRPDLVERLDRCPCCAATCLRPVIRPAVNIGQEHFREVANLLGLSRCRNCTLTFVNPRPSKNLLVAFYNRDGYECHDRTHEVEIAERGDAVRLGLVEQITRRGTLLDFGAGAGHLLRQAIRRGWSGVTGVELGQSARHALVAEGFDVHSDLDSW